MLRHELNWILWDYKFWASKSDINHTISVGWLSTIWESRFYTSHPDLLSLIITFFKVCKSVHHHTIQINHQPDKTIFQFIILKFIYSSTCFGRFPAHHQELNDCSGSLWCYLRIVVIAGPTMNTARLSPWYEGKTRRCHCSHWAPDDGLENARNMLSCK
jgi:hypothetical protein